MNEMFSTNPNSSTNEQVRKLNEQLRLSQKENDYLYKRNKALVNENVQYNGRILLSEQINEQRLARAKEERETLEVEIKEL